MQTIPICEPYLVGNEKKYLDEAITTGWVSSQGKFVREFEEKFAKWLGIAHATSCSNGTTALHLALLSLGVGKGDEVIIPNQTFVAVANMVKLSGAEPVFVDIRSDTWNIDESKIGAKITPKTKAVIVVHSYGCPAQISEIKEICSRNKLFLIEDCAEAHGAKYKGKTVGTFGDVSTFSFFGNKIITTGEGGMVCSDNKEIIEKAELLKNHGMKKSRPLWHEVYAFNYRLTNLQAAVGLGQLENIGTILEKKAKIFSHYRKKLLEIGGLAMQAVPANAACVDWLFTAVVLDSFGKSRDEILAALQSRGVDCRRVHYAITELPIYSDKHNPKEFANAVGFSANGFSLPSSTGLLQKDLDYIISCIKEIKNS